MVPGASVTIRYPIAVSCVSGDRPCTLSRSCTSDPASGSAAARWSGRGLASNVKSADLTLAEPALIASTVGCATTPWIIVQAVGHRCSERRRALAKR